MAYSVQFVKIKL